MLQDSDELIALKAFAYGLRQKKNLSDKGLNNDYVHDKKKGRRSKKVKDNMKSKISKFTDSRVYKHEKKISVI